MRASTSGLGLFFSCALVLAGGCDSNGTAGDAGFDAGGDTADTGVDGGVTADSGVDGGRDGGPTCTTGCAYTELALGAAHSCARRENGQVRCWGRGQDGELGDDRMRHLPGCNVEGAADEDCGARPTTVALTAPATSIAASGGFSTCAITDTADVWCWGSEGFRIGGIPPENRYAPQQFPSVSMIDQVSDSYINICFVEADGTPLCAGSNGAGQVGIGTRSETFEPTQVVYRDAPTPDSDAGVPANIPLTGVLEIRTSTAFGDYACARTASTVYCWGSDASGQLGTGDATHESCSTTIDPSYNCSSVAVALPTADLDGALVAQLAVGQSHACAVMTDGTMRCWGENRAGQLGVGDTMQRNSPTVVTGLSGVVRAVAAANHTCALLDTGAIRCWGVNNLGQIGDGTEVHGNCMLDGTLRDCVQTPTAVSGIDDATFLATGRNHSCAIRESGEVWCWGDNDLLQLGDGPTSAPRAADRAPRYTPVMVEGL